MMKVNIERRSIDVPACCLPSGTFFQYKEETPENSHGTIVTILDIPYRVIHDVEFRGWV